MLVHDGNAEARIYGRVFARDARRGYVRSHIHKCKKTCVKNRSQKGGSFGAAQICRFHFVHGREVLWYPRRWPGKLAPCKSLHCSFCASGDGVPVCGVCETSLRSADGQLEIRAATNVGQPVHDERCPADVPVGVVRRIARLGKGLVLPRKGCPLPHVCLDEGFGGVGKVLVLRYHPDCSSSHPALQVCFRCNFDVQCTDRVFVCTALREVYRRRRVKKSAAKEHAAPSEVLSNAQEESLRFPEQVAQQESASDSHQFRPQLRGRLRGGASLDDSEDEDFVLGEEPSDLEVFTENARAPELGEFFEEEHVIRSGPAHSHPGEEQSVDEAQTTGPFDGPEGSDGVRLAETCNVHEDPLSEMLRDLDEEAQEDDAGSVTFSVIGPISSLLGGRLSQDDPTLVARNTLSKEITWC